MPDEEIGQILEHFVNAIFLYWYILILFYLYHVIVQLVYYYGTYDRMETTSHSPRNITKYWL